ncbi:MAG: GNAT family protein [Anaerolineae bacterium]|jgi:RimJ/RimL family protein N-acetyltransferase|nr:GNAT family protein [Anaerolineae bacterium]
MKIFIGDYLLRDWQRADALAITSYANNPKIAANLRDGFPHPYGPSDAEAFLARAMAMQPPTFFAIANETEAIGSIGLMLGQDVHRLTAEMGYWLAEPFWGRGIMVQAVTVVVAYAFTTLGLNRVYAEPYTSNPASARVLEKAGFQLEGILRASVLKNGKVLDQAMYARIRPGIAGGSYDRECVEPGQPPGGCHDKV